MKNKKTFKDRIIDCIGRQKPTSWGLSIGLNTGTITRIFSQDKIPTWKHLVTISMALNKSINWLLTGKELHSDVIEEQIPYNPEEQHQINKLIEILRNDKEDHTTVITHNINVFCGDRLWVKMGRPERRKKAISRPGMYEKRIKVHVYKN